MDLRCVGGIFEAPAKLIMLKKKKKKVAFLKDVYHGCNETLGNFV